MAKKFKCSKCKRSFSMAAHLARHMTSHGVKKKVASARASGRKKATRGRPTRRTATVAARRGSRAGAMVTATGVIKDMESFRADLVAKRDALDVEITHLEEAIDLVGGALNGAAPSRASRRPAARAGKRRGPGRPRGSGSKAGRKPKAAARGRAGGRAGSLSDHIAKVLSSSKKPLGPREISAAVKKSGYKTKSKDLSNAVSNALPKIKGVKRVGFGKYSK